MCLIRTRCRVNQEKFHFGKCLVVGIIVAYSTHVGLVCSDHSTLTSVYTTYVVQSTLREQAELKLNYAMQTRYKLFWGCTEILFQLFSSPI